MSEVIQVVFEMDSSGSAVSRAGIILSMLLVVLLVQKEWIRAANDGPRVDVWMRALDIVLTPVLLAFIVVISLRVLELLSPM